jgi:hypothetical protein
MIMSQIPNSLHAIDIASIVHPQSNLRKDLAPEEIRRQA